jgi:ribosomal protein S18 acetylase RimI-like enzyme
MIESYNELSREELVKYNHANFIKMREWYTNTPRGNMYRNDNVLRYETEVPGPLWSGILMSSCNEDEADSLIEKHVEYFCSKGLLGFMWYVVPSTNPRTMGDKLEAQGFSKVASSPMMSIDLHSLPKRKEIPGLEIRPVRSKDEMKIFDKVLETQFQLGEATFKKRYEIECSVGFEEDCPRQLYVAYQDGIPVSTNFMLLDDDVAGWYKIVTHPDYERRGIGTAMTLAPLYDAKERGYNVGVLQSTEAGYKVYSRLGFKEDGILDWYMYTWDKEARA